MTYPDPEDLHERIEQAMKRRKRLMHYIMLGTSTFLYVLFMIIMWGVFLFDDNIRSLGTEYLDQIAGLLVMPTVGWLISLVLIGIAQLANSGKMDNVIRREVVNQELGQHLLEQYMAERAGKAKRAVESDYDEDDPFVTVSDDGELVPLEPDEDEQRQQRQ